MKMGSVLFLLSCLLIEGVMSQTGLTATEEQEILNRHNILRGQVNPSASNMERMVWNDELAEVAQNYAEQCVFEHNSDRVAQQNTFTSVGENLAAGSGPANFTGFVQSWYNEVQDYNFNSNSCTDVCGHYTQVVWATSRSVGCGAYRCSVLQNAGPNWVILVCNYGPAGNFVGQSPYLAGSSCSACPDDLPFCTNGLCSTVDDSELPSTSTDNPGDDSGLPSTSTMNNLVDNSGLPSVALNGLVITVTALMATGIMSL